MVILYHMSALACGIILDLLIGDPHGLPHPIRLIGKLIDKLDKKMLPGDTASIKRNKADEQKKGRQIVFMVLLSVFVSTAIIVVATYLISPWLGAAAEAVLTFYVLAARSLKDESMKVYERLEHGSLEEARKAVSMIVGRDTENLDKDGVTKAAVETVAENTSDGVIAPLLYTAIAGPIIGFLYKAINTMDSMIGYKNERYMDLGRAAAKLDDAVNYIPSRISALLIIFSAFVMERLDKTSAGRKRSAYYSSENARRIFKRDRFKHNSPNSAQTESAVAGALGICLAGDAVYGGKVVKKPTIGDELRKIETEDIKRANKLMYASFITAAVLCIIIWGIIFLMVK